MRTDATLTLGSTEAIKAAVVAGMGVAIVSRLSIDAELAAGLLTVIPVAGLQINRALHLLRLRNRALGPSAAAMVRMLLAK